MTNETKAKENFIKSNLDNILLVVFLGIFLVVSVTLAISQPHFDNPPLFTNPPDEAARFLVPMYIFEHGIIPNAYEEAVRIPGYGYSHVLFNAFPYIIMGYVCRVVGIFSKSFNMLLISARMVNVCFGLIMAYVVRLLSKRVIKDRWLAWLFACLVTFMPQALFMHTYVNSDSMCMMSVALIIYSLVCIYQDKFNVKNCAVLSLGVICCALSYYNAYGYILSAVLICLAYFKKDKGYDFKSMLRIGSIITGIVLAGILWWFIRNGILYDGDFLGLKTRNLMQSMYGVEIISKKDEGYSLLQMLLGDHYLSLLFNSFVAMFGSMSIPANIWIYRAYKLLFAAGTIGCVLSMPGIISSFKNKEFKKIFFHINMIFCMVITFSITIYYAYTMDYQYQGRYLLPMLIPLMYYMVKGYERILNLCTFIPRKVVNILVGIVTLSVVAMLLWYVFRNVLPVL